MSPEYGSDEEELEPELKPEQHLTHKTCPGDSRAESGDAKACRQERAKGWLGNTLRPPFEQRSGGVRGDGARVVSALSERRKGMGPCTPAMPSL